MRKRCKRESVKKTDDDKSERLVGNRRMLRANEARYAVNLLRDSLV
jgi:hypothetical protein